MHLYRVESVLVMRDREGERGKEREKERELREGEREGETYQVFQR